VGRTGRAGRKGTAHTFITPEDDQYAGDMCKALKYAEIEVPEDLTALASRYERRVKEQEAQGIKVWRPSTGYKGKGFKFDEKEGEKDSAAKAASRANYGAIVEYKSDNEEEEETGPTTTENRTALAPGMGGVEAPDPNAGLRLQAATMAAQLAAKQNANMAAVLANATGELTQAIGNKTGNAAAPVSTSTAISLAPAPAPAVSAANNPALQAALQKAAIMAQRINAQSALALAAGGGVTAADAIANAQRIAAQVGGQPPPDEAPATTRLNWKSTTTHRLRDGRSPTRTRWLPSSSFTACV